MSSSKLNRSLGQAIAAGLLVATACATSGCAGVARHVSGAFDAISIHADEKRDLARIREETREELAKQREEARKLAAQREIEQARYAAQREALERQLCQANQEALQRQVRSGIKDTVESKMALRVEHGLEFGQPEVDLPKLEKMIEALKKMPPPTPPEPLTKTPCKCCDAPCGCQGGRIKRRHCPLCRKKPCQAEETCGGPEALEALERQPPQPLMRLVDVPINVPARLTLGIQNPEVEALKIIHTPPPIPPCDHNCCDPENCPSCTKGAPRKPAECPNGHCPVPGVGKTAAIGSHGEPVPPPPVADVPEEPRRTPVENSEPISPPVPEADTSAESKRLPRIIEAIATIPPGTTINAGHSAFYPPLK